MFSNLTVFQTARAMAMHAGARQALIAQNVANSDTPGYRARDLPPFSAAVSYRENFARTMRSSRQGHNFADAPMRLGQLRPITQKDADPNDNGVSLEDEMVRAAEAKREHDRALAIYRSALTVLRSSIRGK